MELLELKAYCENKLGAEAGYPFGEGTLVFKVAGKMFALMGENLEPDDAVRINLKCDPDLAQILRQTYAAVQPGYHMNKKHWNTVICDRTIPDDEIQEMIDNSYDLVIKSLSKRARSELLKSAEG